MQARKMRVYVQVSLSRTYKGKPRKTPVWVQRYRLPSGKQSRQVLGLAWTKKGRPPHEHLTEEEARMRAQAFAEEHGEDTPDDRRSFAVALESFLRRCTQEKGLRGSTVFDYRKIGRRLAARPWRGESTWADRPLEAFAGDDLLDVRRALIEAGRSAETVNHYRRVVRGVFGTHRSSPVHAWEWMTPRVESEGKLRFYTPEQVTALLGHAHCEQDIAIYTLATEAGSRLSEIRALKVGDVNFGVGVVRFEDGFTTTGGFAGNKGRRLRSVPMSANVRSVLLPLCQGKDGDALVFEHQSRPGQPICGTSLYRRFLTASRRAGLPRIRFPRPAAHVRHPGDPCVQGPRGPADDGPPPHHDHRALPALHP